MLIPLMQALLRLPRVRDDRRRLPLLPATNLGAEVRPVVIAPRRLHEDVAAVTVAGLRDRALSFPGPARVLARHEAEVGGQLSGAFEAAPVDDLRGQHHRALQRDPAEALEAGDGGGDGRRQRQRFNLSIEFVAPLAFVHEQRVVLAEDEPIRRRERGRLAREVFEPPEVRGAPVGAVAVDEPAPGQELEAVVARLEDLALEGLPAADDVTDALLGLGGNPDWRELAGAVIAGEVGGVALVVFPLDARALRDEGGREHVAGVAPLPERAVQDVSGATGLAANAELAVPRHPVEEPLELRQVVR